MVLDWQCEEVIVLYMRSKHSRRGHCRPMVSVEELQGHHQGRCLAWRLETQQCSQPSNNSVPSQRAVVPVADQGVSRLSIVADCASK